LLGTRHGRCGRMDDEGNDVTSIDHLGGIGLWKLPGTLCSRRLAEKLCCESVMGHSGAGSGQTRPNRKRFAIGPKPPKGSSNNEGNQEGVAIIQGFNYHFSVNKSMCSIDRGATEFLFLWLQSGGVW
jgi:hypothetical protein